MCEYIAFERLCVFYFLQL